MFQRLAATLLAAIGLAASAGAWAGMPTFCERG
jgi:hypothetical protein